MLTQKGITAISGIHEILEEESKGKEILGGPKNEECLVCRNLAIPKSKHAHNKKHCAKGSFLETFSTNIFRKKHQVNSHKVLETGLYFKTSNSPFDY